MSEPLVLPEDLTIHHAADWHARLSGWASGAETDTLCLHGGAVVSVDAAGIQLLLSLARTLAVQGRRLSVLEPSAPLVGACTTLGVAARLLPSAEEVTP